MKYFKDENIGLPIQAEKVLMTVNQKHKYKFNKTENIYNNSIRAISVLLIGD